MTMIMIMISAVVIIIDGFFYNLYDVDDDGNKDDGIDRDNNL